MLHHGMAAAQETDERTRSGERGATDRPTSSVRYVFAGIGIDEYEDPAFENLGNAKNDLEAVQQTLTQHFGFHTESDLLIRDGGASEGDIKRLVRHVLPGMLRPEDRLVLFYAGHGAWTEHTIGNEEIRYQGHIVPHDASGQSWSWIKLEDFLGWVDDLPAQQILVVLDACHAGFALPDDLKPREEEEDVPVEEMQTRRARRVLTSAKALEFASDGGDVFPSNSAFTGWLTEGLRREAAGDASEDGPNRDDDTVVSSWELFHFIREQLQESGAKHTPAFGSFSGGDTGGQIVFPLAISPEDAAYDRAVAALGGDQGAFMTAAEAAVELLGEDDARSAYLRFRMAQEQFKVESMVEALLELREFGDQALAGTPMSRDQVEQGLDRFCKVVGGCDVMETDADVAPATDVLEDR